VLSELGGRHREEVKRSGCMESVMDTDDVELMSGLRYSCSGRDRCVVFNYLGRTKESREVEWSSL
jgi:hypothetical protein